MAVMLLGRRVTSDTFLDKKLYFLIFKYKVAVSMGPLQRLVWDSSENTD